MSAIAITLCIVCQFFLVGGQILLKHATNGLAASGIRSRKVILRFAGGIGLLSIWFFLWLGLLQDLELSKVYPFEGLNPALLVVGAAIFLRERVSPRAWIGIGLISAGVALVSSS